MPPFSSPFPPTSSKPGHGSVVLSLLPPGTPTFTTLSYTYPLKLLPSTPHTIPPPPPQSSSTGDHASTTLPTRGLVQPHGPVKRAVVGEEEAAAAKISDPNASSSSSSSANNTAFPAHLSPTTTSTTPPHPPTHTALLFLLTYGGGLLAGDRITLHLILNAGTRLVLATQGMGKVFPPPPPPSPPPPPGPFSHHHNSDGNNNNNNNPSSTQTNPSSTQTNPSSTQTNPSSAQPITTPPSTQTITAHIHPGSALFLAPDPSQPFARSRYLSHQTFDVARGGSVGVVEWVVQGRGARGECWDMGGWRSGVDVFEADVPNGGGLAEEGRRRRLVVRDNIVLENGDGGVRGRMDGMGVLGTVVLYGPLFASLAGFFVGEFEGLERVGGRDWGGPGEEGVARSGGRWRGERQRMEREQGVVWTACHVRGGKCCVVKFMAREMQGAREWLGGMLREEATVGREFGEGGLMFVR